MKKVSVQFNLTIANDKATHKDIRDYVKKWLDTADHPNLSSVKLTSMEVNDISTSRRK
jgi:hypothetical protein